MLSLEEVTEFHTIWLALTYKCNNKCAWCYAGSDKKENCTKNMSTNSANTYIKLAKDLNVREIILIGGEPTCHSDLGEIIREIKAKNMRAVLVTNGRKLSSMSYIENLKSCGLNAVAISIEGYNAEQHEAATRVKGSFDETMQGLENCLSAGIPTSTETTISTINCNDIFPIVDLLASKSITRAVFNICTSLTEEKDKYTIPPIEAAKYIEDLYLYGKSEGLEVHSITPLPLCNFNKKEVLDEMLSKGLINTACYMFYGTNFVIDYNGDIIPCVHLTGKPFFNILKEEILNAKEFLEKYNSPESSPKRFRDALWTYASKKCMEDAQFERCLGGCPMLWFAYDPKDQIKGII